MEKTRKYNLKKKFESIEVLMFPSTNTCFIRSTSIDSLFHHLKSNQFDNELTKTIGTKTSEIGSRKYGFLEAQRMQLSAMNGFVLAQ